jgi:hypothetical protein
MSGGMAVQVKKLTGIVESGQTSESLYVYLLNRKRIL